jgi:hypothetical protein
VSVAIRVALYGVQVTTYYPGIPPDLQSSQQGPNPTGSQVASRGISLPSISLISFRMRKAPSSGAALVNALNEAMLQNADEDALWKQFAGVLSYTAMHFTSEERLMAEGAYSAAAEHRKEHERLLLVSMERPARFAES